MRAALSLRQKTSSTTDSSRNHHISLTGTGTKPMRTPALEVEVEEEEEEDEEEMGNPGMNGHDSSSEKRGVDDSQEGEGEGRIASC